MNKDIIISQGLSDLSQYFRRKLSLDVEKMYKEKLQPYHHKTIATFFQEWMDRQERFPFLHEVISTLQTIEELSVDYSEHPEKFPILKMWDGFNILKRHGSDRFISYCNSVNMPPEDRERVIMKFRCVYPDVRDITNKLFTGIEPNKKVYVIKQEQNNDENISPEQKRWDEIRTKAQKMKRVDPEYKNHIRRDNEL